MTEKEFVSYIGLLAVEDMKKTGILASITAAQAILESGYGKSDLAANANNLFGMKANLSGNNWASEWDGKTFTINTGEQKEDGEYYTVAAAFRKYQNHAGSIKDHSDYLTGAKNGKTFRYAGISSETDYRTAAQIIKNGGYATSLTYVDKLCNVIEKWNLTQYDKEAPIKNEPNIYINKYLTGYNHNNGEINRIKYIVIHYVGALGDAKANCQYYAGGNRNASAHYFIGFDGSIWQSVEDQNVAWHCGSTSYNHPDCRNANSIGIEMCVRNKGSQAATSKDWYFEDATVAAAVELTKCLMGKYGISKNNVIRHYDVTGKICPNPYVYNTTKHTWEAFKQTIEAGEAKTAKEKTDAKEIYRVRTTWDNSKSQIGAYSILENAIKACIEGYSVFDSTGKVIHTTGKAFSEYKVRVDITDLRIRTGPGINHNSAGYTGKGIFTIIEEAAGSGATSWGRLKSGAGWVSLDFTTKL